MSDLYDPKYGYSYEEIALLQEHDEGETLHAFIPSSMDTVELLFGDVGMSVCAECGDTEEGLMHNNTWRNTEPLMEG